jgi:hypothetical protein
MDKTKRTPRGLVSKFAPNNFAKKKRETSFLLDGQPTKSKGPVLRKGKAQTKGPR